MYAFLLRDALQKRGLCSGKMSVSLSHAGIVGVQGQQHKQHTEKCFIHPLSNCCMCSLWTHRPLGSTR